MCLTVRPFASNQIIPCLACASSKGDFNFERSLFFLRLWAKIEGLTILFACPIRLTPNLFLGPRTCSELSSFLQLSSVRPTPLSLSCRAEFSVVAVSVVPPSSSTPCKQLKFQHDKRYRKGWCLAFSWMLKNLLHVASVRKFVIHTCCCNEMTHSCICS